MVSQNILNLVDTLMVGRLGSDALAAVGMGGFVNFLSTAFITGLAAGVQAMAARRKGQGRIGETAVALNGGLLMVVVFGVPLTIATVLLAPFVYPTMVNHDAKVVALGVPYLQVRLLAMISVGANFAFRGYWNGISRPGLYLRTLLIMHGCNVVISYVLIFGAMGFPALGVQGAAVGTAISTCIGTLYYLYLGRRYAKGAGFLRGLPSFRTMRVMVGLSIPSGVQTAFFAGGLTALFSIVARVGTPELAAAGVLVNIMLVAILPGLGLGLAAASLVGQALGRKDPDDAVRWGWDVVRIAAVVMGGLGLPMLLIPKLILSPFFLQTEQVPFLLAVRPLQVVGATIGFDAAGMVLLNALHGAGATKLAMMVSIATQWGLFLPIAFLVGPTLGYGLLGIWIAQAAYRTLQAGVLAALWRSKRWARVAI